MASVIIELRFFPGPRSSIESYAQALQSFLDNKLNANARDTGELYLSSERIALQWLQCSVNPISIKGPLTDNQRACEQFTQSHPSDTVRTNDGYLWVDKSDINSVRAYIIDAFTRTGYQPAVAWEKEGIFIRHIFSFTVMYNDTFLSLPHTMGKFSYGQAAVNHDLLSSQPYSQQRCGILPFGQRIAIAKDKLTQDVANPEQLERIMFVQESLNEPQVVELKIKDKYPPFFVNVLKDEVLVSADNKRLYVLTKLTENRDLVNTQWQRHIDSIGDNIHFLLTSDMANREAILSLKPLHSVFSVDVSLYDIAHQRQAGAYELALPDTMAKAALYYDCDVSTKLVTTFPILQGHVSAYLLNDADISPIIREAADNDEHLIKIVNALLYIDRILASHPDLVTNVSSRDPYSLKPKARLFLQGSLKSGITMAQYQDSLSLTESTVNFIRTRAAHVWGVSSIEPHIFNDLQTCNTVIHFIKANDWCLADLYYLAKRLHGLKINSATSHITRADFMKLNDICISLNGENLIYILKRTNIIRSEADKVLNNFKVENDPEAGWLILRLRKVVDKSLQKIKGHGIS